jgi:hypothetical protein
MHVQALALLIWIKFSAAQRRSDPEDGRAFGFVNGGAAAERSGEVVTEADRIGPMKVARDRAGPNDPIERGDRTGIVGPNGGSKTTLINIPTGALASEPTGNARRSSRSGLVRSSQGCRLAVAFCLSSWLHVRIRSGAEIDRLAKPAGSVEK